jgi:tetratricopeptide (TPR) repeat protein
VGEDGRPDLDAALKLGPRQTVVHTLRGIYWRRQGNQALSFAEYSRAARLEPENPALQSLLGEAHASSGDLVAALEAYQHAVELAPSESTYWRLLALFCADNDVRVLDIGLAAALKAVELAPKDPQALDVLGWTYAQAGYLSKSEQALLQACIRPPSFGTDVPALGAERSGLRAVEHGHAARWGGRDWPARGSAASYVFRHPLEPPA